MITQIEAIWLPVSDMGRAIDFYRDTLGLEVLEQDADWSMVTAGDQRIGLNADESPKGSAGAVVAFGVDGDLEHAVEELKAKGVEFPAEISEHHWGRIATFRDPDDNDLQLYAPPR